MKNRWSLILACLVLGVAVGVLVGRPLLQGQPIVAPAIPKELTSYRDIVKRILPAVVSIETHPKVPKTRQNRRRPPIDERIPEEFRKFFEELPEMPDSPAPSGFGSGFLVDPKGVILTNNHVVDGADEAEVRLYDGRKFVSKNIKRDPKTDLAILRIEAKDPFPYLELGDSSAMEIGDRVLAVGAPFGLTGSVTHGIISAKARSLRMNMYEDFLQTDAAINPGNSGGPLVNLEGQVIGINAAIKSRTGGFQGVGLAVSSNLAKNIMKQLLEKGAVQRGYLGVQIKDLDNLELAKRLGLKDVNGVVVTQVFDNAPGAKAGVQDGDVIVELDGKTVKDGHELQTVVASLPLGKPVSLEVVRDGQHKTLQVTIAEQPAEFGNARVPAPRAPQGDANAVTVDKIGVEVTELTPDLADSLGYKENLHGVVVTRVDPDGLAASAGLRRGMLITKVNKKAATTAKALRDAVDAGSLSSGILLQVHSPQGGTSYVLLKASANP